jgi:Uri superfamily endonuclease
VAEQPRTYQLHIRLASDCELAVGRLGVFRFPAGLYLYTGSAKRNMEARIRRHCSKEKRLRWHIDYLLAAPDAEVVEVQTYIEPECDLNRQSTGRIIVPGFGASDCRMGCGSHLKYLGGL